MSADTVCACGHMKSEHAEETGECLADVPDEREHVDGYAYGVYVQCDCPSFEED